MAIARPGAALWPEVEQLSGWPKADEDRMRALADAWRAQGDSFVDAAALPLGDVRAGWADEAGTAFHGRASAHLNRTGLTGNEMAELGRRADAYADELVVVKSQITEIMASSPPTVWDETVPGYRAQHVQELAGLVNRAITDAAGRLSGMSGATPLGRAEPLPQGGPADVRLWWETQPEAAQDRLKAEDPDSIRNLDGIPAEVRDETNRAALGREIAAVEAERAELIENPPLHAVTYAQELAAIDEKLDRLRELDGGLPDTHYLLGLDAAGDGKAIVAVGNPDTADNVATIVPGTTARLGGLNGDIGRAERLAGAAAASGQGTTATIAWLGYDAPDDVGAGLPFQAYGGEVALSSFQDGLRATHQGGAAHQSVIAHSYGGVLAGQTARDLGLDADDLILVAAPGTGADHVSELRLDPVAPERIGEHVHAIVSPDDWINNVSAPLPGLPAGHGLQPTDPWFGAHVFEADNGTGDEHSGYFDTGTAALGSIAALVAPPAPR